MPLFLGRVVAGQMAPRYVVVEAGDVRLAGELIPQIAADGLAEVEKAEGKFPKGMIVRFSVDPMPVKLHVPVPEFMRDRLMTLDDLRTLAGLCEPPKPRLYEPPKPRRLCEGHLHARLRA